AAVIACIDRAKAGDGDISGTIEAREEFESAVLQRDLPASSAERRIGVHRQRSKPADERAARVIAVTRKVECPRTIHDQSRAELASGGGLVDGAREGTCTNREIHSVTAPA